MYHCSDVLKRIVVKDLQNKAAHAESAKLACKAAPFVPSPRSPVKQTATGYTPAAWRGLSEGQIGPPSGLTLFSPFLSPVLSRRLLSSSGTGPRSSRGWKYRQRTSLIVRSVSRMCTSVIPQDLLSTFSAASILRLNAVPMSLSLVLVGAGRVLCKSILKWSNAMLIVRQHPAGRAVLRPPLWPGST